VPDEPGGEKKERKGLALARPPLRKKGETSMKGRHLTRERLGPEEKERGARAFPFEKGNMK